MKEKYLQKSERSRTMTKNRTLDPGLASKILEVQPPISKLGSNVSVEHRPVHSSNYLNVQNQHMVESAVQMQ